MLPTITLAEQWGYIKATWRLVLLFALAQVVGGGASLFYSSCPSLFGALWYGVAFASPIGFSAGLAWQWLYQPSSIKTNLPIVLILGLGAVVLPLAALSETFAFLCTFHVQA